LEERLRRTEVFLLEERLLRVDVFLLEERLRRTIFFVEERLRSNDDCLTILVYFMYTIYKINIKEI
jgi:hypothetical protein